LRAIAAKNLHAKPLRRQREKERPGKAHAALLEKVWGERHRPSTAMERRRQATY